MNILNISLSDLKGGASIAAYRLHLEFNKLGHNSKLLVSEKISEDSNVTEILGNRKLLKKTDKL